VKTELESPRRRSVAGLLNWNARRLSEGTEENHEISSNDGPCADGDRKKWSKAATDLADRPWYVEPYSVFNCAMKPLLNGPWPLRKLVLRGKNLQYRESKLQIPVWDRTCLQRKKIQYTAWFAATIQHPTVSGIIKILLATYRLIIGHMFM